MTPPSSGIGRAATAAWLAVALWLVIPGAASSQEVDPGVEPVHALLRNGGKATVTGSLATYGGHDMTRLETTLPTTDIRRTSDGNYGGASGSLFWARPAGRASVSATASTDLRYYGSTGALSGLTAKTTSGSIALGVPTGRNTSLRLSQSANVSSFFQFDPFSGFILRSPDDLLLPTSDYRVDRSRTLTTGTTASLTSQVSRYSLLTFDYAMRYVDFPGELLTYSSHSQGVRFERRVRPSLSFRTGYGYDFSRANDTSGGQFHRIDLGLSYDSRLPFSRNTFFSASSGGALVAARAADGMDVQQVPLVTVSASLRHQVNRRWGAVAEYRRAPRVVELYRNPTYGDFGLVSLQGTPARRLQLSFTAGVSRDKLDAGRGPLASQTVYGSANLSVRASRMLFTYVEYAYYGFETGAGRSLLTPQRNISRKAVRGGIYWRMPLFRPIQGP